MGRGLSAPTIRPLILLFHLLLLSRAIEDENENEDEDEDEDEDDVIEVLQ